MSRSHILSIALAALTIAGLACSAGQSTPTPTPIPTATEPPQAAATSAPTPKPAATSTRAAAAATSTRAAAAAPTTAPRSAGVLFNDDFSSQTATEDNGWDFDSTDNVDRAWSANKYTLSVKKKNYLGYGTPNGEYSDFGAEVEAQANSAYARYGIRFRMQGGDSPSYYIFVIATDGKYYVDKLLDNAWADPSPVETTATKSIKQGKAKNTLGVLAQGSQISLYINRSLVKTFTDDSIDSGTVGVLAGPGDNDSAEVTFSRLTVLTAEKAKADWAAAPAPAQPTATATKASGGGSGNGTITVRNTFDGACQINLWGQKEATIRAEGNSSKSLSLPPGKYGVHAAVDAGEVDLSNQLTLPPGGYCVIYCTKATKSVSGSCGQ